MGAKLLIGIPWMQNESVPPPPPKKKKNLFGLCVIAWFLWQPIANLRRGICLQITHISAVTNPRLLNLIPN